MRKWVGGLAALALVAGLSATVTAGPVDSGEYRIALSAQDARRTGLEARRDVGRGRVTANVTEGQLQALTRQGVAFDVVPVRWVGESNQATVKGGKPGSGRSVPASQVPYGVKMIYGDPALTAAGVGGGQGVTVAVLDTGSVNHADFTRPDGSRVITGCVDFSQNKNPMVEGTCTDGHGHGTHVTGTVAAAGGADGQGIFGVAPGANVFSYKVMNNQGRGYADDIANAIRVAADRGANIISMSLGSSTPSQLELDAIRYANSLGVLVIAAAGNSGPDAGTIGFPGGFAEVVAVAALNPDEVVSFFSSRGISDGNDNSIAEREVEVAGPGRSVLSTARDGGYTTMSGTSMATPHIAGLAAKMWQGSGARTRAWLQAQARRHDITRAEQINNASAGYDIASGYGLPQVQPASQPLWNN